jgi:hypothetical protein
MRIDSTVGQPRVPDTRHIVRFVLALAAILCLAALLRGMFPRADPPWFSPVGVVWHDEGAWVHNARNRALTGQWQVPGDAWNPMYVTPVLTGLEFLSFTAFGVGVWQSRLVSQVMGVLSVLLFGLGMTRIAGPRAGLAAAALLATNFVAIMFDRAALMEATMVALIVAAWYGYGRARESPRWGALAGAAAMGAYFTKASAIFFLAALAFDALLTITLARGWLFETAEDPDGDAGGGTAGAWHTLAGLVGGGVLGLALFVLPHWESYRFYNWQMSVTRKPVYTLKAVVDRASWLPVIHDFFTRIWVVTVLAVSGAFRVCLRWRHVSPAERVLLWWLVLGITELILHDVGNERRLVFLIPALIGLATLVIVRERRLLNDGDWRSGRGRSLLASPFLLAALYLVAGPAVRLPFLGELHAGNFRHAVRWSAALAVALAAFTYLTWPRLPRVLSRVRWTAAAGAIVVVALMGIDLRQYWEWASIRTYKNYDAMVALGQWLPPGTVVHGRLANGLALENRIVPLFVGRNFGNYEDRATRRDARYVVTYVKPTFGYESQASHPIILDVLAVAPGWKVIREFDVAETPWGRDRAVLIDKYPNGR